MRHFSFDHLIQLCDQYVHQKARIWIQYDTIISVLDAEANMVPNRVKAQTAKLETSWANLWKGISIRRGCSPEDFLFSYRFRKTLKALESHAIKSAPVDQTKEREWAEKSRRMAIQSLDDEYIALLEAERMKQEAVFQGFDKLSLEYDKKTEVGY